MKQKVKILFMPIFIFALSLFLIVALVSDTFATSTVHEIYTFDDLVKYAALSRTSEHSSDSYILKNDIVITDSDYESIKDEDYKYISFGSEDYPFSGTFDGKGFTISNLKYSSSLEVTYDTGLFSRTNGAVVKNLTIDNADITSDYRGGIISGYSKDTLFLNVTVKNSYLFVSATNNVLTLITDGGIRGGAIVGEAENSILYNCESNNNIVSTNNTAGVAALSGKGLTLGGLVGILDNSLIEYSRVKQGSVKNYYDVAVGALGGNTLYVGGIAGKMRNSSQIIDSFSTAQLYYYCATYVSVGAGNSGHIGGISATMEGSSNEIIRSHYAGVASSKQYNAVLVIPIIQNNVNISGIVDVFDGGVVVNSYFKPSLNSAYEMNVLGNDDETSSYGPLNDETYINKTFWQDKGYDFYGTIRRSSDYNNEHYNKWVVDNENGILVHGKSISATLDFPNAGVITIDKTALVDNSVSTSNPYSFATQGLDPAEVNVNLSATENKGYRFLGWYKVPNVTAWQLEENYEYFNDIFNRYDVISTKLDYKNVSTTDNDLFIAKYEAKVLFYDINKNLLDKQGNVSEDESDDWYEYEQSFPDVVPVNKPSSDTASLIGWTTKEGGYSSITTSELTALKNEGAFYELDGKVTSSVNLYPVYADLISNVTTIFEGNELDSIDDASLRDNIGYTSVTMDSNGIVTLKAYGYGENNTLPSGYRFLGWYDSNGNKLSKTSTFKLEGYDLNQKHTFIIRLEYEVNYYGTSTKFYDSSDFDGNPFESSYANVWHTYEEELNDLSGSLVLEEGDLFNGWYNGIPGIPHKSDEETDCEFISSSTKVTSPLNIHAHVSGDSSSYEIYIINDFPGSADTSYSNSPAGADFTVSLNNIKDGYNFLFWASGRRNGNRQETSLLPTDFDSGSVFLSTDDYGFEAHLDANVVFHDKSSSVIKTVTRRYKEKVFSNTDITYQYTWPIKQNNMDITIDEKNVSNGMHTSLAFAYDLKDTSMEVDGYKFIGWIDKNSVTSSEWNYIYNTSGSNYSLGEDPYVTSSTKVATPYLLDETDIVTKPMDIYPVYVKYKIITKTNVPKENMPSNINIPSNPSYVIENLQDDYATIVLTPNLDTNVTKDSDKKYVLTSFVRLHDDGKEEIIEVSSNGTYEYEILPDITYTFIANYEPVILIYHLDDNNVFTDIKYTGDEYGNMPNPLYDTKQFGSKFVFKGWTKQEPNDANYYTFTSFDEFTKSDIKIITSSMVVSSSSELWPVYVPYNININSNIDSYLTANGYSLNNIRTININDINNISLVINTSNINNYYFKGWYLNYVDENNIGDKVSDNLEYVLEKDNMFTNKTYTAVYKEIYEVNYYGTDNTVLYKINVAKDEQRSFVKLVQNEDGSYVLTPIDYNVYELLYSSLNNNELFKTWQWQKQDGTLVLWDEFYDKTITSDMDLYPIINKVTAKDSKSIDIDLTDDKNLLIGVKNNVIYAGFNTIYDQSNLTINVEEIAYSSFVGNKKLENVNVIIYPDNSLENEIGNELTDINGDAMFKFYGLMNIKEISNIKDEVYILEIINDDTLEKKQISLNSKDGIKLKLPYGNYSITINNNWSWRYNSTVNGNSSVNNSNSSNIEISNEIINKKWFDKTKIKVNKF